ncbi:MAG: hypothetical protein UR68_C0033G0015 [Candidatus Roizmanbacteria bacterium GW2011_GWA2_35_19]|uniref:Uncharacterized protein n=1 Tax=Candidatus Roizmanbacteria bacterium GW2011_GWA2_35_19 TaxID=1618478 RepID=A0A0G0BQ49_9BACT|nr:MAG: hypothetical protein UR68_C0033G0015 [Candidatus Roizmanbacteria bacterium GW2011_GWA2_35_19]
MLTPQDIKLIEKSFDKKLKPIQIDIDAIHSRVAGMETGYASKLDYLEIRNLLTKIEKRITVQDARLMKVEMNLSTIDGKIENAESNLSTINGKITNIEVNMVTKKEFKPFRSKLDKLAKDVRAMIKNFDSNIIDVQKRTDRIDLLPNPWV